MSSSYYDDYSINEYYNDNNKEIVKEYSDGTKYYYKNGLVYKVYYMGQFIIINKWIEEMLKSIPYTNIGIVKCNIKTEGKLFKTSEMEIKVYPEDVIEITQFIS